MKFNIEKPFSINDMNLNRVKEKALKKMFFIFSFVLAAFSTFFIYQSTISEMGSVLDTVALSICMGVIIYFVSLGIMIVLTANIHNLSFKRFQYIFLPKLPTYMSMSCIGNAKYRLIFKYGNRF